MLISYLKCICSILLHKWLVITIGRKIKIPWWNLIIHDLSKFLPSEFPHLARKFFGTNDDKEGFSAYYLLHTGRNAHHPRYWVGSNDVPLPIPMVVVKEMVVDWASATIVYSKVSLDYNNWTWFNKAFPNMNLHSITRERVIFVLNELKRLDK